MKTIKVKTNITNEEFDKDMIELGIMKIPHKENCSCFNCSNDINTKMKIPKTPNEEIRIRITKEELHAIYSVSHNLEMKYYSEEDVLNWASFLTKLKRFYK